MAQPGGYMYQNPGVHEHDGMFLRLNFGPGYTRMAASEGGTDVTVAGSGGALNFALGGSVAHNLIVYGELIASVAVDPTIEINGTEFSTDDVSAGVVGLGIGLAYYTASNVYVSGTLAAAQLSIQADQDGDGDAEEVGETDFGPTVSAQVGKEWWASDNWGVGLAGQVLVGSMKDGDSDVTWTATAFNLLLSATYD
jgi:hypothetical protein